MSQLRLHHVAFESSDATAAFRFLDEVLGLELIEALEGDEWDGAPWLMMVFACGEDCHIALCARDGGAPAADLPHVALAARGPKALALWRARIRQAGLEVRSENGSLYFEPPGCGLWEIATHEPGIAGGDAARERAVRWLRAHPPSPRAVLAGLIGKRVHFRFDSGFVVEAEYLSDDRMRWHHEGRSAVESISSARIAPGVVMVSWLETGGTSVSHVIDMQACRVWSFVTWEDAGPRRAHSDRGRWDIVGNDTSRHS